jgi:hypothetical protein
MRTTRFGTNRFFVTDVEKPGCRYDLDGSASRIEWTAEP